MTNHPKRSYYLTTTVTMDDTDREMRLSTHASLFLALWAMHDLTTPLTGTPVDVDLWVDGRLIPQEWAYRAMARVVGGEFSRKTPAATETILSESLPEAR